MQEAPTLYLTQGSGNNFKPMLVCQQLGLQCNRKYIDVLVGENRQQSYLDINPQGVVPFMTLADGTGLGESNAIAWYLAEGSHLIPESAIARAQAIRWMNFEQTALEPNISPVRFFTFILPDLAEDNAEMIPVWRERGNAALRTLDKHLATNEFVTGCGYSVADIAVFGYTHLAGEGGFDLSAFSHISAWIERVENQPGYVSVYELLDGKDFNTSELAA